MSDEQRAEKPKQQRDGLNDMADAHDYLLGFILFHLAGFYIDPEREGDDSELLQKLRKNIGTSSLSEGAKEWAANTLLHAEISWNTYMQMRHGAKPQ